MTNIKTAILILVFLNLISCKDIQNDDNQNTDNNQSGEMSAQDGFDFANSKDVTVSISTINADGTVLSYSYFKIYSQNQSNSLELLGEGSTDENGRYESSMKISNHIRKLVVETQRIGLPRYASVSVEGFSASVDYSHPELLTEPDFEMNMAGMAKSGGSSIPVTYMGSFNSLGVPSYLEKTRDVLPSDLLTDINASLPESKPVPSYHPDYLANGNETNTIITELADVWITFVHEGAGWKNSLGYYTYDLNNPPETSADIKEVKIILPNVSYMGSGGGLNSGDKVYLGRYKENTGIGWVLVADAWNGNSVGSGNYMLFSESKLNRENATDKKQHVVMLNDEKRGLILLGFEDINRESSSDNDFNDAVFYVTSNPVTAIEKINLPPMDKPTDSDGDHVSDVYDRYPDDASRAFDKYYPAQGVYGTVAFEDSWPVKGDFDFNDLVIKYNVVEVTDVNSKVMDIKTEFIVTAAGASQQNGFAFSVPVSPGNVKSVTGSQLKQGFIKTNSNGTESGQNNTVVVVSDNVYSQIHRPGTSFMNTVPSEQRISSFGYKIEMTFNSPVSQSKLGTAPYDLFMIANLTRGREIHMINNAPTDLVDKKLFSTADDFSSVENLKYYRTSLNMPWVISLPYNWDYPKEKASIDNTYNWFRTWVLSSGNSFKDWYTNSSGYRNEENIFK